MDKRLIEVGEPWRYYFYFLSPEDYTSFFEQVRDKTYKGWRSGLMHELET
jgi:type III restriction enzyme